MEKEARQKFQLRECRLLVLYHSSQISSTVAPLSSGVSHTAELTMEMAPTEGEEAHPRKCQKGMEINVFRLEHHSHQRLDGPVMRISDSLPVIPFAR
jgi:hypothetical protein